jgi:hypothetical protein
LIQYKDIEKHDIKILLILGIFNFLKTIIMKKIEDYYSEKEIAAANEIVEHHSNPKNIDDLDVNKHLEYLKSFEYKEAKEQCNWEEMREHIWDFQWHMEWAHQCMEDEYDNLESDQALSFMESIRELGMIKLYGVPVEFYRPN